MAEKLNPRTFPITLYSFRLCSEQDLVAPSALPGIICYFDVELSSS